MPIGILNNIASLAAENQLTITNSSLQSTLYQLSSGSRINSGADDAAGLAIANGLQANVSALTQSARNANDGVGALQVADGALAQVTTLLNRAVTLATEAATGTVGQSQRGALQAEYLAIQSEIDRIGSNTNYNGTAVFNTGTATAIYLSDSSGITTQASNFINVSTGNLQSSKLLQASGASATLAASDLIQAGDTVKIGGVTYTFVAAGANNAAPAGVTDGNATATAVNVKIDGSTDPNTAIQNTLQNLANAVNGGAGAGSTYEAGAANLNGNANPDATAIASGNTVTFSATVHGLSLASIASVATPTANEIAFETGAGAAGTFAVGSGGTDLNTAADAQVALSAINAAIQTIAGQRGQIGAGINRLQSAVNVINNQVQNLTSAENGITAADIPTAVANMTKYSILEQTGISSLAQANQQQQLVLKLLQ